MRVARKPLLVLAMAAMAWAMLLAYATTGKETVGPLFPVIERDLLDHIDEAIEPAIATDGMARQLRRARIRAAAYVKAPPPVAGLVAATVATSRLFDPTVRLRHAISDADGNVLHPAGTAVNPLDQVRLDGLLVLLDERVPAQAEFARRFDGGQARTRFILTGGEPGRIARQLGARVYFDQYGAISERLGIDELPAIVSQEGMMLRIDTVALATLR